MSELFHHPTDNNLIKTTVHFFVDLQSHCYSRLLNHPPWTLYTGMEWNTCVSFSRVERWHTATEIHIAEDVEKKAEEVKYHKTCNEALL